MNLDQTFSLKWSTESTDREQAFIEIRELHVLRIISKKKAESCIAWIENNHEEFMEFSISMNITDTVDLIRDLV